MDNNGFESVHGGYDFGQRTETGTSILKFALKYNLCISNAYFEKKEEHLFTFESEGNKSQIDFFILKKNDRLFCKNYKVIPGESIATQH